MHEKTADPEKGLLSFMTQPRLRVNRATTPGRGIDHDGRTLARGFQDGNLLWRSQDFWIWEHDVALLTSRPARRQTVCAG